MEADVIAAARLAPMVREGITPGLMGLSYTIVGQSPSCLG